MGKVLSFELFRNFTEKMTRGLSLQMVFSLLFPEACCLFEAHHVAIRWPQDAPPFSCFRSKRVDSFFFFVHEEHLGAVDMTSHVGIIRLPLTSLCGLPLLFVYFQVNNGVLYFLDYVEDIYIIIVLSVLVSIFNPNHMYLPLLLTVYCIVLYTNTLFTICVPYNGGLLPDIILLTQGYYHRGTRLNTM